MALLSAVAAASAETIFPPGSGVGLDPPQGMTAASGFVGFQKGAASIVIVELPPEAFAQINGDRSRFAKAFEPAQTEDFASADKASGFIVRGRQTAYGKTFRKWAVVIGSPKETAAISAQVPLGDTDIADAAIEAALKTIVFRERPSLQDQIAALPFTVGDFAGFRPAFALLGLGLTEGPNDTDPDGAQPFVNISTGLGAPEPDADHLATANTLFMSLKSIKAARIVSAKAIDSDGVQWVEIQCTGNIGKVEAPHDVSLFVRFGADDLILITATAPVADHGRYGDRFRRIALSVRPKT